VIRIVLAGGGAIASLLELLEELEPGEPQGSIATVCVSVLLGITSRLEPGGMVVLPDSVVCAASEHDDPPPLLPHADRTAAAAAHVINAATRRFLGAWIVILLLRSRS
jgi:hypothetical protein